MLKHHSRALVKSSWMLGLSWTSRPGILNARVFSWFRGLRSLIAVSPPLMLKIMASTRWHRAEWYCNSFQFNIFITWVIQHFVYVVAMQCECSLLWHGSWTFSWWDSEYHIYHLVIEISLFRVYHLSESSLILNTSILVIVNCFCLNSWYFHPGCYQTSLFDWWASFTSFPSCCVSLVIIFN
jgi:hypothetical protein